MREEELDTDLLIWADVKGVLITFTDKCENVDGLSCCTSKRNGKSFLQSFTYASQKVSAFNHLTFSWFVSIAMQVILEHIFLIALTDVDC